MNVALITFIINIHVSMNITIRTPCTIHGSQKTMHGSSRKFLGKMDFEIGQIVPEEFLGKPPLGVRLNNLWHR